jgi:hypothetical protein
MVRTSARTQFFHSSQVSVKTGLQLRNVCACAAGVSTAGRSQRHPRHGLQSQGSEAAVSLMMKVRDKAGGLVGQAKAKYTASGGVQKAGHQAGQAAGQVTGKIRDISGKAASGQTADRLRDLSGKATSSDAAGRVRDMTGKATAAVKSRAHRPSSK